MKVLRWIGIGFAALLVVGLAITLLARSSDGPLGPFPGGPMDGAVVSDADVDWDFAVDIATIAIQTSDPPRSRTVWSVVHEGALYVPCGYAATKDWPKQIAGDPVVLLRLDGRLFLRTARRVEQPDQQRRVYAALAAKYGLESEPDFERDWIYRMDPFDPNARPGG